MSAAILQGVPATTLDTDLWIDLPERQYVRVLALCRKQGAQILAATVVALTDDTMVNFLYHIDGIGSFEREFRKAKRIKWLGQEVAVLPLARICKSKSAIQRPKDLAHLPLIRETMRLQAGLARLSRRREENLRRQKAAA